MVEKTYNIQRPPLYVYGRKNGGILFGVCKGLSVHLQINVTFIRIFMTLFAFLGAGLFLYIWLLAFIPKLPEKSDQTLVSQENSLIKPVTVQNKKDSFESNTAEYLSYGIILLLIQFNYFLNIHRYELFNGLLVLILGLLLIFFEILRKYRAEKISYKILFAPKYLLGSLAVIGSVFYLVVTQLSFAHLLENLAVSGITIATLVTLFLPLSITLFKSLVKTQYETVKEKERANIAAHLHDGVLQTLALIQKNSKDPNEVEYLARTQERDLRAWLYGHRPDEGTSVSAIIKENLSAIENTYRKNIDLIVVGDCNPNKQSYSFIGALREAVINALTHGALPVSVYVEITDEYLEFYVRDRGQGFDIENISPNRFGVRNSIMKRVENAGGKVKIKNTNGCEIHVEIPMNEE